MIVLVQETVCCELNRGYKGANEMSIETINPATGALLHCYDTMTSKEVDRLLHAADAQFQQWRRLPLSERCQHMASLGEQLSAHERALATLMTQEMGKPIQQSLAEIKKCRSLCDYQVEHIATWLMPGYVETEFEYSAVHYEPIGVLLAIMPWNFPFWQVFRFAVSQILAGNVVVLKHAPNVTGCAIKIANLFREAGFPEGVFTTLVIETDPVAAIIDDQRVQGVALTGSAAAGKIVGSQAGAALKKVSLELGGSDPLVVLKDADLKLAAEIAVQSRMANAGQICIAPKRCIVVGEIYEEWLSLVEDDLKSYHFSDPTEDSAVLGPLAREDLRKHLHQQISDSIASGAKVHLGGEIPQGDGFYYPATLLTEVLPGMPAFDQELFGPIVTVVRAVDEEHAIELANQSIYGLGASIFTRDLQRGRAIAVSRIQAGSCYINAAVVSDPRFPIGGIKSSGVGRELSDVGLKEFMNVKVICAH